MVKSKSRISTDSPAVNDVLHEAMRQAGVSEEQIKVVLTILETPPQHPELPEELVTLREAAERFGTTVGRLKNWVYRGHIRVSETRLRASARGGGKLLVNSQDVARVIENPPRTGRPPKN